MILCLLFLVLFGQYSVSEMQWYGNDYLRSQIIKHENKWLPILFIIDLIILYFVL